MSRAITMLRLLFVAASLVAAVTPVRAQFPQRQFNIFNFNNNPSQHALDVFHRVKNALGVPRDSIGMAANSYAPNAMATMMPVQKINQFGQPYWDGQKLILYNPSFMTQIEVSTGSEWAAISIIAHEVGHHIGNHVTPQNPLAAMQHPWQRELEADYYSGLALAKLGAGPDDLQKAQRLMFSMWGSPTHPDTARRIQSINRGWRDGGGSGDVDDDLMSVWNDLNDDLQKWWY